MSSNRRLLVSLLTMLGLLAAACGTVVPPEQQEAAEAVASSGDDLGSALPEGATVNEQGQVVSASGEVIGEAEDFGIDPGTSSSGTSSSSSGGTSGGTTGGGTTGGGTVATGENGPGVSADTIKIGVAYADDAEEANAAVGATGGAAQINSKRAWEGMVKYVNEHGGVAGGRKLEIVFHRISTTSTEPYDQQDQEVCDHWSQDDPVFVSDGGFKTENGIACFQKRGMVSIVTNGLRFASANFFERYPTYLEFDGVDNDAIARMYADNMKKLGFFDKGYKLGIVTWSDPEYANPTKNTLVPRLQELGITVSDVTYITTAQSGGEAAGPIAEISNAALRYNNDDITHVMFMDSGAAQAFFFMQSAERQQYRPRYGLTSSSGNTGLANVFRCSAGADSSCSSGNDDARRQLEDAVSIGWWPTIDLNAEDVPSWARSPAKKVCYQQMEEAGVEMADSNARGLAENICNNVWTIQATLDAIPGDIINQQTWYQALSLVNDDDVLATSGMGYRISKSRRDALEFYAQAKFFDDCICFKYTSGPLQIPD